jgi:ABC-type sulfate/molybdate transport systems ATPase subunit
MVLVTHDSGVAAHADRVIHLKDGTIQKIETTVRAHNVPALVLEEAAR